MFIDDKKFKMFINLKKEELAIEDAKKYHLQRLADELNAVRFVLEDINCKLEK